MEESGVSGITHAFLPWQEAPISINKRVKKHETMKELMPLGLRREFVVSEGERGGERGRGGGRGGGPRGGVGKGDGLGADVEACGADI